MFLLLATHPIISAIVILWLLATITSFFLACQYLEWDLGNGDLIFALICAVTCLSLVVTLMDWQAGHRKKLSPKKKET